MGADSVLKVRVGLTSGMTDPWNEERPDSPFSKPEKTAFQAGTKLKPQTAAFGRRAVSDTADQLRIGCCSMGASDSLSLLGKLPTRRLRDNGLFLACMGLFGLFFVGMAVSGWQVYNDEQISHGGSGQVSFFGYFLTGDFIEATFENWESEFLQMAMYVVLTAFLVQRGSSESKPVDGDAPQDADPRDESDRPDAPRPVRRGGWVLKIYENSLAAAFFALFFASLALHAVGGARAYSAEQLQHGDSAVSVWRYLTTSQFWFESMQNWQSEFIAVAAIVVLSVFLRQRNSAESKPVADPHTETGS